MNAEDEFLSQRLRKTDKCLQLIWLLPLKEPKCPQSRVLICKRKVPPPQSQTSECLRGMSSVDGSRVVKYDFSIGALVGCSLLSGLQCSRHRLRP